MRSVPRQRLDLRSLAIEKRLQPLGDVHVSDGRSKGRRRLRFRVGSPGYGLPVEAVFEYTEWYARTSQGWLLTKYVYEYRPEPPPSRLAHHLHEPLGAHRHCVDTRSTGQPDHYEDYLVVLEQAHEEFAALAARRRPVSCTGLRPLSVRRHSAEWIDDTSPPLADRRID